MRQPYRLESSAVRIRSYIVADITMLLVRICLTGSVLRGEAPL